MRYAIWYQTLKNGVRMFSQNAFLTSRLFTNVCYFYCHPNIATSKPRSLTTLFSTKMKGGGNTVTRTSTSLSFKFVVETIRHFYCMLVRSFI